jgi:hypothetical protein
LLVNDTVGETVSLVMVAVIQLATRIEPEFVTLQLKLIFQSTRLERLFHVNDIHQLQLLDQVREIVVHDASETSVLTISHTLRVQLKV